MTLEEFKNNVVHPHKRQFKITNSLGVYDIYKTIRKEGWKDINRPLKENEFYAIVRGVNEKLAEALAAGKSVEFPYKMGKLELRKFEAGASFKGGKLKVTYPIDWGNTLKLWYEDLIAKKNKTLIRKNSKEVFFYKYCKYRADFENKVFYGFSLTRNIKKLLKENIDKGKIDTLW